MQGYYVEQENEILNEYGVEFFRDLKERGKTFTPSHVHPSPEILYITNGCLSVSMDDETVLAHPGDCVLLRANVIHAITSETETGSYLVLKICPSLLFDIFVGPSQLDCAMPFLLKSPTAVSFIPKERVSRSVAALWRRMADELDGTSDDPRAAERIYAAVLLLELVHTVPELGGKFPKIDGVNSRTVGLIYRSVAYINGHYAADLTAEECAESINISYSYFAKLFRSVMGKTFKEYLNSVRMSKARNLLLSTNLSITDIAFSCGYGNLSYFTAGYRRLYRETPRETRRRGGGISPAEGI